MRGRLWMESGAKPGRVKWTRWGNVELWERRRDSEEVDRVWLEEVYCRMR